MIVAPRDSNQPPSLPKRETPAPAREPQMPENNAAEHARWASVNKPLDRGQKSALVILAKQAWERVRLVNDDVGDFESWRQQESLKAAGVRISDALVKHFSILKRHFADLAGQAGKAFNSAMREGTEDKRIARHKLEEACEERGLQLSYPAAICRRQFKRSLDDASAKQLWCLVFTVRNRRKPGEDVPQAKAPKGGQGRNYTVKRGAGAKKYQPPKPDADEPDPF
jgi:hypothetical protein